MDESDYIPIAALNHYAYCPHRCWRMFVAGEFLDNSYTPNGLEVNFFQKRRQESEERLCVRSLDQQSSSGKIGYEKTDIKQI